MNYMPVQFDTSSFNRYVSLFSACFPTSSKYSLAYLEWLYCNNPDGLAVGFDAWDGDELAAHYVTIPVRALVCGVPVRALLSLNTATHPSYQGKGLFTRLANLTYQYAADHGFDAVYGVANANSTPGFTRKLGFTLIDPLIAKIGFGRLSINQSVVKQNSSFERTWSAESLAWRCGGPHNKISGWGNGTLMQFHASAVRSLVSVYAEMEAYKINGAAALTRKRPAMARLFIGLLPDGSCPFSSYWTIPNKLRPSPLNFIYKPLTLASGSVQKGSINLSFLDFDAY